MEFKQATYEDIEQLVQMRMKYLEEDFKEMTDSQRESIGNQLPRYFSKHLGNDMVAFVAKEQNTIISTALLLIIEKPANPRFLTGEIGEVLSVYTVQEYRRKGIAGKLMQMLLSYAKERALDFVELKATQDGYPLYKQLGFKENQSSCVSMKYDI